jgi:DNA-binding transcriptional MerR regulator
MLTVKQLSKIAGVTPRTLRYYDQIGLLKPSQVGDNGYRYYGEEAVLRLQQILLYRQLELPLENIHRILARRDFEILSALESHKKELRKRVVRMERLIATVDHTIDYLKGNAQMTQEQLFEVFNDEQQAEYEKEALQKYDPEIVKASNARWRKYTPTDRQRIGEEGNAIYSDLLEALPKGAASPEVQACIERWRQHMSYFWTPSLEQLVELAEMYSDDPRFKANFDKVDPRLAEFMGEAVKVYVEKVRR